MSVFGGDSWAREAHHRKRRVDHLFLDAFDSSSFNTLSNGKFTCLVCPNRPVLDSSLMLSMHSKGARHKAELSRLKEKGLIKRDEINKRIALSDSPVIQGTPSSSTARPTCRNRPLIEQARKATLDFLSTNYAPKSSENERADAKSSSELYSAQAVVHQPEHSCLTNPTRCERLERELKFTAAGWKRDGYGRWYRDENVEFDSDEEDPNVVFA